MYNENYECRYYKDDIFLESDDITEEEKEYIHDVLYREDFLNIFGLENYDFNEVNDILDEIYEKIKTHEMFKNIMEKIAGNLLSQDSRLGLLILYSYDYMYLTHMCISEFIKYSKISKENIDLLYYKIFLENV